MFKIRGLNDDNINVIGNGVANITKKWEWMIAAGLDDDVYLEFRYISVEISDLNEHTVQQLDDHEDAAIVLRQSMDDHDDTLNLNTTIKCNELTCDFIIELFENEDDANDRQKFEEFVSLRLNEHFESEASSTNADGDRTMQTGDRSLCLPSNSGMTEQRVFCVECVFCVFAGTLRPTSPYRLRFG